MKKIFLLLGLIFLAGLVSAECIDADGDGYGLNQVDCAFYSADCYDANPDINPGAEEICGNGIDEDCSEIDEPCPKCPHGFIYYRCSCGGEIYEPNTTQPDFCCNNVFNGKTLCENCTEPMTEQIPCTTEQGCPGTKICMQGGIWYYTKCHDDPEDNCPCIEEWECGEWSACTNRIQTRTCTEVNGCSTLHTKPSEVISCGECNPGITQQCVTNQGCPGTQVCQSDSSWNACSDIPNDNCPNIQPPKDKEFFVMIQPEVLEEGTEFTITVIEENAVQNARIEYANNVYLTNSSGQAEITAEKEFDLLKVSKTDYVTQTIVLNIIKYECGNGVCEEEYENETSCPADCKPVSTEMKINTSLNENVLTILVTDAKEEPLSNVQVIYVGETKSTNTQGITTFDELPGEKTITAVKEGYQTKIITYLASTNCDEGNTKECTTEEECPGTQICENGEWTECFDLEDDCPGEFTDTTVLLTVVFIMGIMLLAGVKIFT